MHILHICSDFSRQRIYSHLVTHLSGCGVEQTVYVPVRTKEEMGKYEDKNLQMVHYKFQYILKIYHRFLFNIKINTIYKNLITNIDVSTVNLIHAHFLFSDGAVALKIKKNKGISYIVAVRNTDLNIFYKYMPHLRLLALEILKEAKSIIFITPSYRTLLLRKYIPIKDRDSLASKMFVIPNGIESFWIKNIPKTIKERKNLLKLLYVGDFTCNKNVPLLIKSVKKLCNSGFDCTLTLVGGGGRDQNKIVNMLKSPDFEMINYEGYINNRATLLEIYRSHDVFIMISFKETFGVVYLEAMSQGLPVIYSKNQGIYGYFKEGEIGYSVNPKDTKDIKFKIGLAKKFLYEISKNNCKEVISFDWKIISSHYLTLYYN